MDVPGITELAGRVRTTLAGRIRVPMAPGPIPAAVLLPLFERDGEVRVLFTKRTEHLNHHRGEISFPGGVSHPDDASPCETALRETWEEIGIPPDEVDILGELDDFYSVHDYLVTPCVGVIRGDRPLVVNPDEIERIIVVPLKHLLRPEVFRTEDWTWRGRTHPVHFYRYMDDEIWGLTAAILSQFLNTIFPRP
ncbi:MULTISPECIES: CoA pyrophosphatase [Geobacter]|uniref:CoA pyrophosphatase n=1 Tax=Geobacter TaxID=28231 RepID=UPI0025742730|nr:CoA pyrophosphatase [Geobacter sulfurreducens]BEH11908.1 CoA pyrophosphatase [Geobacter sulfurreducens subsp. ethanolicus]